MATHNLKNMIRAVQQDLPITMRMEKWLVENPNPTFSTSAVQHVNDFLSKKVGGNRARQSFFRPSGAGKCHRMRVLARIGTEAVPQRWTSSQANILSTGNMMHLKWQLAGLTEGWLTQAEVPLTREELDLQGTADGTIFDGSLFEYKTINDNGYKYVTSQGPRKDHQQQVASYRLLNPDFHAASIVYENKNNGEWREFRVQFTDELMQEVTEELAFLRESVRVKVLPDVKPLCQLREGTEYQQCPFRDSCLSIKGWPS